MKRTNDKARYFPPVDEGDELTLMLIFFVFIIYPTNFYFAHWNQVIKSTAMCQVNFTLLIRCNLPLATFTAKVISEKLRRKTRDLAFLAPLKPW